MRRSSEALEYQNADRNLKSKGCTDMDSVGHETREHAFCTLTMHCLHF
jgi:hypothetical protein